MDSYSAKLRTRKLPRHAELRSRSLEFAQSPLLGLKRQASMPLTRDSQNDETKRLSNDGSALVRLLLVNKDTIPKISAEMHYSEEVILSYLQTAKQNNEITKLITIQPGPIGISIKGKKVRTVLRDSQAEKAGISVGWKILQVNGQKQTKDHVLISEAINKTHALGKATAILFQREESSGSESDSYSDDEVSPFFQYRRQNQSFVKMSLLHDDRSANIEAKNERTEWAKKASSKKY